MEKPNYYAILPANIRYDSRLKPMEKILFSEITALSNAKGFCYAKNQYFAKLYEVHKNTVSNWINHLAELGYIKIQIIYEGDTKNIRVREIGITNIIDNNSEIETIEENKEIETIEENKEIETIEENKEAKELEKIIETEKIEENKKNKELAEKMEEIKKIEAIKKFEKINKNIDTSPKKDLDPINKNVVHPINKKVEDNNINNNITRKINKRELGGAYLQEIRNLLGERNIPYEKIARLGKSISRIKEVLDFAKINQKGDGWIVEAIKYDYDTSGKFYPASPQNNSKKIVDYGREEAEINEDTKELYKELGIK